MVKMPVSRPYDFKTSTKGRDRVTPSPISYRIERLNQRTGQWEEIVRRVNNQYQLVSFRTGEIAEECYPISAIQRIVKIDAGQKTVWKEFKK
jgi:hypothetical protein